MAELNRPIRVLTNRGWLGGRLIDGRPVVAEQLTGGESRLGAIRKVTSLWRYDIALFDCESSWLMVACAARKMLPFARCRIVSVDIVLTRPRTRKDRLRFVIRRWLLKEVDRFVLYFRDTSELERVYSIDHRRVHYVPFKPNTLDRLRAITTSDEGFFLACGRSNRDYGTLFRAMRDLPYRCEVLAPWTELEMHGTAIDDAGTPPPNVTLASDDGTVDSWNGWIARARAVVLPVQPGMLSPSGIGTYLVAMALAKCVIITDGPATRGILDDRLAVIVPPHDVDALREALRRVAEDDRYRTAIAGAGQAYALSLAGEERLRADVLREIGGVLAEGR